MTQPNFAHPDLDTQNWYVAARSSEVHRGRVASYQMLHRRIALYRDSAGAVHALDARCAHLGADLGQGIVDGDTIQCAFHNWRYGPDGRCISPTDRRVRAYPTEERWGLVWIFNGSAPLFPLPPIPDTGSYHVVLLPSRTIACHPHLVVGNGLDTRHLEALHGMKFTAEPEWSAAGDFSVTATVQGHPRSAWLRLLTGSKRRDIVARFSCTGGNLAWATVSEPIRFHALFTGRPDVRGGCRTQVVLFLPPTWNLAPLKALLLMFFLLHNDRRILERLQFTPAYAGGDEPLRSLADAVNRMPTW